MFHVEQALKEPKALQPPVHPWEQCDIGSSLSAHRDVEGIDRGEDRSRLAMWYVCAMVQKTRAPCPERCLTDPGLFLPVQSFSRAGHQFIVGIHRSAERAA